MVMGPTHAVSGALVGLLVADVLPREWGGPTSTAETLAFAGVCAGAALLPDLDTTQSTVARSFGPVSQAAAKGVGAASAGYYNITRGKRERKRTGGHRTMTHTALFAVLLGSGVTLLVAQFGRAAIIGTLFVTLGLALRGLFGSWAKKYGWFVVTLVTAVLSVLLWSAFPGDVGSTGLGVAIALGCATHCLGDAITKEGIPFLAPFVPWRGQRWWEFKLPDALAIRAGGPFEVVVLGPVLTLAAIGFAVWSVDGAPEYITGALKASGLSL
ncbi:MAG: metal-dependent hydrolase [Rhodococcus sp.]|uniref:metal-dependent hydrolase n=1 Tax=Rhodococcus TaxID=1827 RepID=UPI00169C6450|nr:metal-dependent hydrolase [Rhodococcus sp. (in: high G+C Gram-positive bacteria)]NLV80783.1 metal-dependent hydrolase [Rhodococcus sp. (in: high G+C Gram-positive bacteria)]